MFKQSRKAGLVGGIITGVIILVVLICLVICIKKVPVGYDAVIYSMNGGVQDEVLTQGWHLLAPTKKAKLFTISNEQLLLTQDEREGSEGDESFKVSTSDDASIGISFQMTYRFDEADLINTYKNFRGMDGESIVNNRVKSVLKSKVSEVTTDYSMMDIYSGNRSEINNKITEYLNKNFHGTYGIDVLDASIIDVHPDEQLKEAIDNRVTALQKKQQAKAEQETAKVEAETALIKAKNKAEIAITEAKAEAEANKLRAKSITNELIRMKEAEARLKHGWVTVQSGDVAAVIDNNEDIKE